MEPTKSWKKKGRKYQMVSQAVSKSQRKPKRGLSGLSACYACKRPRFNPWHDMVPPCCSFSSSFTEYASLKNQFIGIAHNFTYLSCLSLPFFTCFFPLEKPVLSLKDGLPFPQISLNS